MIYLYIDDQEVMEVLSFAKQITVGKNEDTFSTMINFPIENYNPEAFIRLAEFYWQPDKTLDFKIINKETGTTLLRFTSHGAKVIDYSYISGRGLNFFMTVIEDSVLEGLNGEKEWDNGTIDR